MHSHCDDVCIGILTNYGLNSDGGGVKVYTKNLVDALKELGVDYAILMREGDPTEKEIKLPENKILYVAKAIKQLDGLQPELILSQGGWFTAIPAMIYKNRNPDVRIIYLYHTHYDSPNTTQEKIKRTVEKLLMTFVLSQFDKVLFVSNALKKNVEEEKALRSLSNWGILYGAPSVKHPSSEEILSG